MMPFHINNWSEVSRHYTGALLLGNGASRAVDDRFDYGSLVQHAFDHGLLAGDVQNLFRFFQTEDFELVLRLVWQASNVNKSLNIPDNQTHNAYVRVRDTLIQAVSKNKGSGLALCRNLDAVKIAGPDPEESKGVRE